MVRRHLRHAWGAAVAAAIASSSIVAAAAPTAPPPAHDAAVAREQLKLGYLLAQDGKCNEAVPHLVESLRLDPRAVTLINLADCEEKLGQLLTALGHWNDAKARAAEEGMKPIGEEATNRAAALEPKIPRLTLSLAVGSPPGATVERDGAVLDAATLGQPVKLDPGAHTVVVRAAGHQDAKTTYTLTEGENRSVDLEVGPVPPPPVTPAVAAEPPAGAHHGSSPLVPIGFGVGIAGLVVGSITGGLAMGKASDVKDGCPANHCRTQALADEASSGKTLGTVSTVGFILGGAGVVVGVVGLFTGKKDDAKVDVGIGPSSFALRGRF